MRMQASGEYHGSTGEGACRGSSAECARERVIIAHRPLVESIADGFVRAGVMREDLVQEGMIGLIKAIDNFEPQRHAPLRVYASRMIAGHIQHFLRDRTAIVGRRRTDTAALAEVISLDDLAAHEGERGQGQLNDERGLVSDGGLGEGFLLREALDCLSATQREALELRFLERLAIEDIAAELSLDASTVEACIEHACSRLARALDLEPPAQPSVTEFDPASGLLSWSAFRRRAGEKLSLAVLEAEPFAVALLQLADNAAVYPDAEQRWLRQVGELLHTHIRRTDLAGRFGERTLALALPDTDLAGCEAMLTRVLGALRRVVPPLAPWAAAAAYPADGLELDELLSLAAGRLEVGLARAA